ncbi:MAG: DUF4365 domain-containing protein [Anaerolineales bacterium]|nr:DUF4365 domain-containing protein [Anaerolineales bacterium]
MKKKLPQRHRSHVQQKESRLFVERVLPTEWKINVEAKDGESSDYGLDLAIEIIENENVTGAHFLMQLKSKDKLVINKKGFISHPCKTSTLQYFLERPELVIYLVYDTVNDIGYWIWVQDFLRNQLDLDWKKQETFTIQIPKDNILNKDNVEKIKNRVLRNHKKEKLVNTVETLKNPFYNYILQTDGNKNSISIEPKYPNAEIESPQSINFRFKFDDSIEGKKNLEAWQDSIKKGKYAEIDSKFIEDVSFSDLINPELFGLESPKFEKLIIEPIRNNRRFAVTLQVFDKSNKLIEKIPYLEFTEEESGTEEILFSNINQLIPLKIYLRFILPEQRIFLKFKVDLSKNNVIKVQEFIKILQSISSGEWIEIVELNTNEIIVKGKIPEDIIQKPSLEFIDLIDQLVFIQQSIKTPISLPSSISSEDIRLVYEVVQIIQTGKIFRGNLFSFTINKIAAEQLAQEYKKREKINLRLEPVKHSINLFGIQVIDSQARILLSNSSPTEKTYKIFNLLNKMDNDENIEIEILVDDPGVTIIYPDWLPKNDNGE